jgi:hypothetical protein
MQQVADWLEKLGLGQYAQRFAENDISFSIPISQIKTSKRLVLRRSVIDASCCAQSLISARPWTRLGPLLRGRRRRLLPRWSRRLRKPSASADMSQ